MSSNTLPILTMLRNLPWRGGLVHSYRSRCFSSRQGNPGARQRKKRIGRTATPTRLLYRLIYGQS